MSTSHLKLMTLNELRREAVKCSNVINYQKSELFLAKNDKYRQEVEQRLSDARDYARTVVAEIAHKERIERSKMG
jgi:hypothetical protein